MNDISKIFVNVSRIYAINIVAPIILSNGMDSLLIWYNDRRITLYASGILR